MEQKLRKKLSKRLVAFALLPALVITGCWDAQDIEERDIATLVTLDKTEEGYSFYVEFAEAGGSSSESGGGGGKYAFYQADGPTLAEARQALDNKADNPIYLGAVNAVVLTESMAYYGIKEYMYRLREITDYRKVVDIFITDCAPEEFSAVGEGKSSVGKLIEDTMQSLIASGQMCEGSHLGTILESLAGPCKSFLLPHVGIEDNNITVAGYYVFHNGLCIGTIPPEESRGIQLIREKRAELYYTASVEETEATVKIMPKKKKIEPSFADGKVSFLLSGEFDAILAYVSDDLVFNDQLSEELKRDLEKKIADDIAGAVYASQKVFKADYLAFCTPFRIKFPVEFRSMDWHGAFSDADFTIEVAINLDTTGGVDFIPQYEF